MSRKFGRNYRVIIEDRNLEEIVIEPPITMEFTVERSRASSANVTHVRLYNLSKNHREAIQKDRWNEDNRRKFELYVGYDSEGKILPRIGFGNINRAYTMREGVDMITVIESYDGGWGLQQARTNITLPAGAKKATLIEAFVNDLVKFGIKRGSIPEAIGTFPNGVTYSGPTEEGLKQYTGGRGFIDNGFVNIIADNEAIESTIFISEATGLLSTPIRETAYIHYIMMFEPSLFLEQIVNIQTRTGVRVNGKYKVYELSHSGIVSPTVSGRMTTRVGVLNRPDLVVVPKGVRSRSSDVF